MFHKVFWNPVYNGYSQQGIEEGCGWSTDHFAIIDNLQYLEYKYEQKES